MLIKNKNGFSLLEISIVLLVVALAVSSGIMVFNKYSSESKISQTEFTMKQVMTAVKKYALKYGELPCPADPTLTSVSSRFGFGQDPGNCANTASADKFNRGMVPVSTLNIYPTLAVDAWGNRMDFIVVKDDTANDALASFNNETIDLRNLGGGQYSGVVMALVSHGENGYGAYSGRGGSTWKADANATGEELSNSNSDSGGRVYTSTPYRGFDDIVYFWTYDQITNEDAME